VTLTGNRQLEVRRYDGTLRMRGEPVVLPTPFWQGASMTTSGEVVLVSAQVGYGYRIFFVDAVSATEVQRENGNPGATKVGVPMVLGPLGKDFVGIVQNEFGTLRAIKLPRSSSGTTDNTMANYGPPLRFVATHHSSANLVPTIFGAAIAPDGTLKTYIP
jgi:hypothetical protein